MIFGRSLRANTEFGMHTSIGKSVLLRVTFDGVAVNQQQGGQQANLWVAATTRLSILPLQGSCGVPSSMSG